MTWTTRYIPPSQSLWQGRPDAPALSSFFQIIKCIDLQQTMPESTNLLSFGLIGFSCDEGIRRNMGRLGAAEGPLALRSVLAKLPLHRQDIQCFDVGDITCRDNKLEDAQAALGEVITVLLNHRIIPIVIGGGHELAFGHYQGIAKAFPNEQLGIVNMDAHFDMRPLLPNNQGSSGTPFLQIANAHDAANHPFHYHCIGIQRTGNTQPLFTTASLLQTHIAYADDLQQGDTEQLQKLVNHALHDNQILYVSLCLDVFGAAFAPGVSAPQVLGLTPWQIIPTLRQLAASKKVVSYDIAELSPAFDIDSRTAKLAAHLVYEIIHHHQS